MNGGAHAKVNCGIWGEKLSWGGEKVTCGEGELWTGGRG